MLGTLWMGTDVKTSVTNPEGRFHHVENAFCADQSLFVTVGSVNPTLTGLVLARKVAGAVMKRATGKDPIPKLQTGEDGLGRTCRVRQSSAHLVQSHNAA